MLAWPQPCQNQEGPVSGGLSHAREALYQHSPSHPRANECLCQHGPSHAKEDLCQHDTNHAMEEV